MQRNTKRNTRRIRRLPIILGAVFAFVLVAVLIHYRGIRPFVRQEYGTDLSASDFTQRNAVLETDRDKLSLGWHVLTLSVGGVPTPVLVHTVDTVAPAADAFDQTVPLGTARTPDAFVRNIRDADVVKVAFANKPDFNRIWNGTVTVVLTDSSDNRTEVPVQVRVCAVVPSLTAEAGEAIPNADRFLLDGVEGSMTSVIAPETMHHVGSVQVRFTVGSGEETQSELHVVDTTAPKAEETLCLLEPGKTADAQMFIKNPSDATDLSFTFEKAPDYDSRELQTVAVRVTDEGGNSIVVQSGLLITGVRPHVIEARTDALTSEDFDNADGQTLRLSTFIPDTPGTYPVSVTVNGVSETLAVTVVDTTPPTLTPKPFTSADVFYTAHAYTPEDFFDAEDVSPVTLSYETDPDFSAEGRQTITVIASDTSGNKTSAQTEITLRTDRNPPHIYGAIDRICYVGEPIAYLAEAFASDDEDGSVALSVESEVDGYTEGSYRVVYSAEDRSGNRSETACTFTLIRRSVTEEEIHALAQGILSEITTPEMVDAEVLKAIFDYVQTRITYTNGSNNNYTDWRKAAYDGYTQGVGDCYNIYALTRALLDEAGIRYLSVERVKTYARRTRHYWVHVNLGTGWYVFDPTWTPKHRAHCFMWTKAQCSSSFHLYWYYREADYPPLQTEPFDYDAVVRMEREGLLP